MTPLDRAHEAMAGGGDKERLAFFGMLAATELHMMLSADETPQVFDTQDGPLAVAFDTEERLVAFTGRTTDRATLPGRRLAQMLASKGIGLGLNLDVAPSSILLPPDALAWLARTAEQVPTVAAKTPVEVAPPGNIPEALLTALDTRLASTAELAARAYLVSATCSDGTRGSLLAFVDTLEGAEDALSRSVGEALVFSGVEAGVLDIAYLTSKTPLAERLARVGLAFELPEAERMVPVVPGSGGPPKLR